MFRLHALLFRRGQRRGACATLRRNRTCRCVWSPATKRNGCFASRERKTFGRHLPSFVRSAGSAELCTVKLEISLAPPSSPPLKICSLFGDTSSKKREEIATLCSLEQTKTLGSPPLLSHWLFPRSSGLGFCPSALLKTEF